MIHRQLVGLCNEAAFRVDVVVSEDSQTGTWERCDCSSRVTPHQNVQTVTQQML